MFNPLASSWFRWLSGPPCLRVYGKSKRTADDWRTIDVYATPRRNRDSRLPLFRGTCITWTSHVIAVGWDFAEQLLREQAREPASRDLPVIVKGGRLRDCARRLEAGASEYVPASEVMAHECGHTWQATRLGMLYWPIGGSVTLFREGPHFWNRFENQASEIGMFGGLVNGSVCAALMARLDEEPRIERPG